MEQAGMRWRIAGAQAILSLRAIYVNDDWETSTPTESKPNNGNCTPTKHLCAILNCAS